MAIVFYLFKKRENLIKPMLHGDKVLPHHDVPASRDDCKLAHDRLLLILAICAAAVYGLVSLGG